VILAALLALATVSPPALPVVHATAAAPRYVRLLLDVTTYSIRGRGEIVIDRATGRFVRRFDAGPVSEREGFDGTRAWRADATGMARIEGNDDQRSAIRLWSYLLARAPAATNATAMSTPAAEPILRLRYRDATRPLDLTLDERGKVVRAVRHAGEDTEMTAFSDYRLVRGVVAPFAFVDTTESGTWTARVRSLQVPAQVPPRTFEPPPPPNDAKLTGVTTVAIDSDMLIDVDVNGIGPLRFIVDTGGQNAISPEAARRAGITVVGTGTVAGAGAELAEVRFARVRSVRVGAAEMRDQPFIVLPFGSPAPFDGIVGYELLMRFAARIDPLNGRLSLAPHASAFGDRGTPVPMIFNERQPQVAGSIDGIPAPLTIDTGSSEAIDVYTPFVRAHNLVHKYRVGTREMLFAGLGGPVDGWFARANIVRLGSVPIRNARLALTDANAGAETNPSVAANVGEDVLKKFVLTLSYRDGVLRFEPVASMSRRDARVSNCNATCTRYEAQRRVRNSAFRTFTVGRTRSSIPSRL
jgi:Aspartyl protease